MPGYNEESVRRLRERLTKVADRRVEAGPQAGADALPARRVERIKGDEHAEESRSESVIETGRSG
jgi:hypothetical protein